ncbi:Streptomycin adenylyltransferase [Sporobacter termitidis DSM 10068]|uniref:Streptomycin adenylyltransferase n=1 Tax=Sporobacter termitidis DSM 10068 TaxID=1123282 RepID=A0A1M5YSF1_9FIRM|nr:Streptomycin adenylyltransferase [Sporobacter termitidis DSM 10068]
MRTEQEMFNLILSIANADEGIRAVYMKGSRANPIVAKDKYQAVTKDASRHLKQGAPGQENYERTSF